MSNLVFDIESDGLLDTVNKVWMIVTNDTSTGEELIFTDYDPQYPSLEQGLLTRCYYHKSLIMIDLMESIL
jgi:hypothetical protein